MRNRSGVCWLVLVAAAFVPAASADSLQFRHGISLIHELKYPADFRGFDYMNPAAPKGGVLRLSTDAPIRNFSDVWDEDVVPAPGMNRTYDYLLHRAGDELGSFYGHLAQGVALSRDQRSLHLRLHPDARWHDGTPITSDDIKFTFDHVLGTIQGKVFMGWLAAVDTAGPREVAFRHKRRFITTDLQWLTYVSILPAHYWKGRNPSETTSVPPLGSGPYRVAGHDRSHVRFERVREYWGHHLPINLGRHNFDEIRYDLYRDDTVAREAFRKGLFDFRVEQDIRHWISYDADRRFTRDTLRWRLLAGAQWAITLNTRRSHLSDVRVREALTLALDFDWQNRVYHHGLYERADSYFANSRFAAQGVPTGSELEILQRFRGQVPQRVFTDIFRLPSSTGIGSNRAALRRARELLTAAGWRMADGALVDEEGTPFTLRLLAQTPTDQRILLPYAESLRRLGIDAHISIVDVARFINLTGRREFDAVLREHGFVSPPTRQLRNYFASDAADEPVTGNLAGISDPVVDALIDRAESAETLAAMTVACRALDRVLLWHFYNIPLEAMHAPRMVYWDKFGRPAREEAAVYSPPRQDAWWYDAEKARQLAGNASQASGTPARTSRPRK